MQTHINNTNISKRRHVSLPQDVDEVIQRYVDTFEQEHGIRPTVSLAMANLVRQSDMYKGIQH